MKFRCDSCGQKYSIADEKAAGKTLKIRCRKCGNTIRVTGKPLDEPEERDATRAMPKPQLQEALRQTRQSTGKRPGLKPDRSGEEEDRQAAAAPRKARTRKKRTPPPPPPPETELEAAQVSEPEEAWYAVISGKQEGPLDLAALRAAVVAGRIGRKTYVWSESIDDWRPISSVTRLRPLLEELESSTSSAPQPNTAAGTLQMRVDDIAAAEAEARDAGSDASLAAAIEQATHVTESPAPPSADPEPDQLFEPLAEPDAISQALAEEDEVDPFSLVPDSSDPDAPPRETTAMFIIASGVNKRRSPVRIAAAVLAFAGFIGGMGYLLSFTGVDLKGLIPIARSKDEGGSFEAGPVDEERARRIREQMLGSNKEVPAETTAIGALRVTARRPAADPAGDDPVMVKEERKVETLTDADRAAVAALYGEKKRQDIRIKVKSKETKEGVDSVESPIDPAVVAKKIGETGKAFQNCVQQELRRNPGFAGGRVTLTVTVLPSGIVKSAALSEKSLHLSDVGVCIRRSIKRVIFPSFGGDGPVDFEVPLVLSTGY